MLNIECDSSASTRKCAGGVGPIGPRPGLRAARRAGSREVRYSGCAPAEIRGAFTCFFHASFSARQFLSPHAVAAGGQLPPDTSQPVSSTSRMGHKPRPPLAAKLKSTPSPEPPNPSRAGLAHGRR